MTEEELDAGGPIEFGVAHLPIDRTGFLRSRPAWLGSAAVPEESLEGLREWKTRSSDSG
jgi:hypothetical protein